MKPLPQVLALVASALVLGWLSMDVSPPEQVTAVSAPAPTISAPSRPAQAAPSRPQATDPVRAFSDWTRSFVLSGERTAPAPVISTGLELAEQRLLHLEKLIQTDPKAALASAVPESTRRLLPPAILAKLETPLASVGDLVTRAVTPRKGKRPATPIMRQLHADGQTWTAHVYGRRERIDTEYAVSFSGIAIGSHAAISDDPVTILNAREVPAKAILQKQVRVGEHAAAKQPAFTASSDLPVLQNAGQYTPFCCQTHAQAYADSLRAKQITPPSFLEASGGNANTDTAPDFAPSAHTVGTKSVLVIVADFSDRTGVPLDVMTNTPITSTYINNNFNNQIKPFINAVSYGNTTIGTVTVTSLLRVAGTLGSYANNNNVDGLRNAALTKAASSGYNHANYDRVILVFPATDDFASNQFVWGGLADLGGKFVWANGEFTLRTISHELLHTYGLRHANLWMPPSGSFNPVDTTGTSEEYGDVFDVMGDGPADAATLPDHPNPWFLSRLGWLPSTAVQSVTAPGTFRLYRYDHPSASMTNPLSLYVDRDGKRQYWLGYRKKYAGHSTHSAAGSGLTLVWGYQTNAQSDLIDLTPATDALDAPLQIGSTFNDSSSGVTFTVSSAGGSAPNEYLDVQVAFMPRLVLDANVIDVDEKTGSANVLVHRRGNSAGAISVDYSTQTGTAVAADFTAKSGTLSWAAGDMSSKTVSIPLTADALAENSETFTLRLNAPVGCVLSHGNSTTININDPGAHDKTYVHDDILGTVYDIAQQPDGKSVVVGYFGTYGAIHSDGIVRLNPDGSVDPSFDKGPGADVTPISCCTRQPDGKFLIGGKFTNIRGGARNYIARLNSDGSLDTSFNVGTGPNVPAAAFFGVNCITVQPDGKILVGGNFTTWNGVARKCLARLNTDGTLDTTMPNLDDFVDIFSGGNDNGVRSIAIYPTSTAPYFSVLVGGGFNVAAGNPGFHCGVIRFTAEGAKDTSFDVPYGAHAAGANNSLRAVSCLAVQPDGKILVGGQFTGFNNVNAGRIARLNATGSNDASFVSGSGAGLGGTGLVEVSRFVIQPDQNITVAGAFTSASGATGRRGLARYLATGARDTTFSTSYTDGTSVNAALLQPDNQIMIGFADATDTTRFLRRITTGITGGSAGVVGFAAATASVNEGSSSTVTVQRTGGSKGAISINYHSLPGSASSGSDFTPISGVLTWADGDSTNRTITVGALVDTGVEGEENYTLALSNPLGGSSLGNIGVATVNVGDAPANQPVISFNSDASSVSESVGTHQVGISLSGPAASGPVTLTLILSGTATTGPGNDYALSTAVTITPPATSVNVPITIVDDNTIELPTETLTLTLSDATGGLINGAALSHTVSISDNEVPPGITDPQSQITTVGDDVTFSVTTSGSPAPDLQWYKGTTPLSSQTGTTLTLHNVQLADADAYKCVATSPGATVESAVAQLGVVDTTAISRSLNLGGSTTFSIAAAGNGLVYQWYHGSTLLTSGTKYTGATAALLTIKTLAAGDVGDYRCTVTNSGGSEQGGLNHLSLITLPPIITPSKPLPPAAVAVSYNPDGGADGYAVPFNLDPTRTPTSFTQTGLPTGLKIHPTTGVIYGKPTVSKTTAYAVSITASNARGKHVVPTTIMVSPLPVNMVGKFVGLIERNDPMNSGLGGRFDLTTATAGTYTGTVVLGTLTHSFSGVLNKLDGSDISADNVATTTTGLTIGFTLNGSTGRITTGSVSNGSTTLPFTAWRNRGATAGYLGYYTLHLTPPVTPQSGQDIPQGIGYASFTIKADGLVTVTARLPDTNVVATTGHISDTGEIIFFKTLYTDPGSLHGMLKIVPGVLPGNVDATLEAGTLTWSKSPQSLATVRGYRTGFNTVSLAVHGARYIAPPTIGPVVMNLPNAAGNARIAFEPFDCQMIAPYPDLLLRINTTGTTTRPLTNVRSTTLTVTNGTGGFTGTFKLVDPSTLNPLVTFPRTPVGNIYYGIIVTHPVLGYLGKGCFALPDMPSDTFPVATTTPVWAGRVTLGAP